jgi:hypothetical protein
LGEPKGQWSRQPFSRFSRGYYSEQKAKVNWLLSLLVFDASPSQRLEAQRFALPESLRDETNASAHRLGRHIFFAGQSPVLIEGTLMHRKVNFALDIESSVDVPTSARPAQGFAPFRSSSLYLNLNHVCLFLRSVVRFGLHPECVKTLCKRKSHESAGSRRNAQTFARLRFSESLRQSCKTVILSKPPHRRSVPPRTANGCRPKKVNQNTLSGNA